LSGGCSSSIVSGVTPKTKAGGLCHPSHPHDLVAAIHVQHLAGDGRGAIAGKKHPVAPSSSGSTLRLKRRVAS